MAATETKRREAPQPPGTHSRLPQGVHLRIRRRSVLFRGLRDAAVGLRDQEQQLEKSQNEKRYSTKGCQGALAPPG